MFLKITALSPQAALPTFARLYGCPEQDFEATTEQLTLAWLVQDEVGETLGALGLRPSPSYGAELVGGAFPTSLQNEAAVILLRAALSTQTQLYAYAETHLLPVAALEAAGLRPFSAYTCMSGPVPISLPEIPKGFRIVALNEVEALEDRLSAQHSYSDRIGHTSATANDVQPNAGGCDDTLSRLAYDALDVPAGICRAWREGKQVSFSTPGVRSDVRHTALRRALLLSVCQAALSAKATQLTLQAWGDTADEQVEDLKLGLHLDKLTPIYVSAL
ncbi:hypothetical protein FNU79_15790 [Deinococcus detaillensis]|uniref:Uncharacterized protein n=1 Tax=Deinococcus detaillensis TaxID=2592048 RepID=A0A553ULL1_9DEIO|nr:hypothetical protein [Deinococcus detaillensis]TSA81090.1 hypothetical protein FNU79_15790 [Deinococcus detaillensis]